jgi:hypothetical protein
MIKTVRLKDAILNGWITPEAAQAIRDKDKEMGKKEDPKKPRMVQVTVPD